MKQGIPSRRARGRGNPRGRQQGNVRNQQMDSNGPVGRLRGTAQQILDRYSVLARDASSSGDMVLAENLWQHAEHYARLLNGAQPPQQQGQHGQRYGNGRDDDFDFDDQDDGRDDGGRDDGGRPGDGTPDAKPEPIVLKPNPEPVATLDLANAEQPEAPPVWSRADVKPASDPSDSAPEDDGSEQRQALPRRRRRTRFSRQAESGEGEPGRDAPPLLKLPEDPSPAALVDLLTRAEEADGRQPRRNEDGED